MYESASTSASALLIAASIMSAAFSGENGEVYGELLDVSRKRRGDRATKRRRVRKANGRDVQPFVTPCLRGFVATIPPMQILMNTGGIAATNAFVIADENAKQAVLFDAPDH